MAHIKVNPVLQKHFTNADLLGSRSYTECSYHTDSARTLTCWTMVRAFLFIGLFLVSKVEKRLGNLMCSLIGQAEIE